MTVAIPLRARDGSVRAYATIDDLDADLSAFRWALGSCGYAQRQVQRGSRLGPTVKQTKMVTLHRVIAERLGLAGAPMIDHRDRDKLNCRRSNLRSADALLNARNRSKGPGPTPRYFGCDTNGCASKHYAKGLCHRCYDRELSRRRRAEAR